MHMIALQLFCARCGMAFRATHLHDVYAVPAECVYRPLSLASFRYYYPVLLIFTSSHTVGGHAPEWLPR